MGFQTNAYLNQATSPAREDPFFTIIVAAYNRPHLLAETIKSLAAQTFQDFEIVVFDNGSQPPVVVESINKPIQVIRVEKNMMLADLINPFYAKARGQWIMPFLGDDDILTRDCLEEVHHLITTTPGEIEYVGCGYTRYNRSNNTAVGKEKWDGETHVFDAKEVAYGFCAGWGIEISQATARSPCCHSSATFVFRGLLQSNLWPTLGCFTACFKPKKPIGFAGPWLSSGKDTPRKWMASTSPGAFSSSITSSMIL
jgi:glycosyltransferase involved in cell wall biosynthesis